jgi:SAM-dependent methyltransferase
MDGAWAYDLATGGPAGDVAYWQGLVEEIRPRRMLELGCATGRLSFPIADAGFAVRPDFQLVGFADNLTYLDRARSRVVSRFPHNSDSIRFVAADPAAFASPERFVQGASVLPVRRTLSCQLSVASVVTVSSGSGRLRADEDVAVRGAALVGVVVAGRLERLV